MKPATQTNPVRLAQTYGYYDDAGVLHHWQEGQFVDDPVVVADLKSRNVLLADLYADRPDNTSSVPLPTEAQIVDLFRGARAKHALSQSVVYHLEQRLASYRQQLGAYQRSLDASMMYPELEQAQARLGRHRLLREADAHFSRWGDMSREQAESQVIVEGHRALWPA